MEKHFDSKILSLYTDGGGEYKSLDSYLSLHGIQHLSTPPYTPQRVALAERRHRHIVETARTLLHEASLPPQFWSFACHHTVYLINCLPTSYLDNQSPFQRLLRKSPNYNSLRIFGCLCYPWLKPYSKNKLESKSTHVSILDSHYPITVTSVLTQFLQRFTYLEMCDLLRMFFHLRHCSPTLPLNQLTWNGQHQQCQVLQTPHPNFP